MIPSCGFEPRSTPITLGDILCCTDWTMVPDAWTPNGTGFAPRDVAAFRSASRSCPPRLAISRAAASVTHALSASDGSPATAGMEYCVPLHDDCTTLHGYV